MIQRICGNGSDDSDLVNGNKTDQPIQIFHPRQKSKSKLGNILTFFLMLDTLFGL